LLFSKTKELPEKQLDANCEEIEGSGENRRGGI
jgi:hypothetical protein